MKPERVEHRLATAEYPLWVQTEEDAETTRLGLGVPVSGPVLCVSSGGCTPLHLTACGVSTVIAVDVNPCQIAVGELKWTLLRNASLEDFLRFFCMNPSVEVTSIYSQIREMLPGRTRSLADAWLPGISGTVLDAGGMQGIGRELAVRFPDLVPRLNELVGMRDPAAQWEYYTRHLTSVGPLVAELRQRRAWMHFGPEDTKADPDVAEEMQRVFVKAFERIVCTQPLRENPYLAHLLLGTYPESSRPFYMTLLGYGRVHRREAHIEWICDSLLKWVEHSNSGELYGADISNVTDLMDEQWTARLFAGLRRVLRPKARVIHRNLIKSRPTAPAAGFRRLGQLSQQLEVRDRSFMYRVITVDEAA